MGVSGSGKSTVGKRLAEKLNCPFYDGDDFHPEANIAKMKKGQALTDEDRQEWLTKLNKQAVEQQQKNDVVISSSALKESYRKILRSKIEADCLWIYLKGNFETIHNRMKKRKRHYMPETLLKSQFDILEEPDYGIHLDIEDSPEELINKLLKELK